MHKIPTADTSSTTSRERVERDVRGSCAILARACGWTFCGAFVILKNCSNLWRAGMGVDGSRVRAKLGVDGGVAGGDAGMNGRDVGRSSDKKEQESSSGQVCSWALWATQHATGDGDLRILGVEPEPEAPVTPPLSRDGGGGEGGGERFWGRCRRR